MHAVKKICASGTGVPPASEHRRTYWNGTNGGVINGGVSQKNTETCKIGRICAKLAGFAQHLREICANLQNCFCKIDANLRKIYGPVCYGTVCSCLSTNQHAAGHRILRAPPRPAKVWRRRTCNFQSYVLTWVISRAEHLDASLAFFAEFWKCSVLRKSPQNSCIVFNQRSGISANLRKFCTTSAENI